MKLSVAVTMQKCYHDIKVDNTEFIEWIKKWPTQLLLVVMEIQLTIELSNIFRTYEKRARKRAKLQAARNYEEVEYLDKKKPIINEMKDVYYGLNEQIL